MMQLPKGMTTNLCANLPDGLREAVELVPFALMAMPTDAMRHATSSTMIVGLCGLTADTANKLKATNPDLARELLDNIAAVLGESLAIAMEKTQKMATKERN